jgi:predicted ATPase/class 3 adenylate cyclase
MGLKYNQLMLRTGPFSTAAFEMKCSRCHFENPEEMLFCGKCGQELRVSPTLPAGTPSAEERLEIIQRYLPQGLAKRILSQKDRIEGERRQVTIMFCDMKGFTPLTERLGPEETFSLMDKIYEILIHQVNEYEGTVNEIRGDGILAVFGALDALEDAPQRAIRSAIEIHKRVAEFSEALAGDPRIGPIRLRIGINTGPVVIGTVGNDLRVQFTVVGDTINMAARMETMAEPGTTYVTEETYRLTKDLFHFQALGKKAIKGKQDPVPVYQVLQSKSPSYRPRLGSERMIYASLVDRNAQLNVLELQVMKLVNGQGSVVNIVGEAGVGKSRLIAELKNREVMKQVTLLEGWAVSIGRNLSFHPITDILKQWAGIKGDDADLAAFNKLQAALKRLLPEDYAEVLPFVATLMGVKVPQNVAERLKGIEGGALEKLILRSMRDLLIKASETSPLIIVMEDLHWADKSSIELLESLLRLAETQSIMFVNIFRPGYQETGDRILQGLKDRHQVYSVQIQVEPLDEKDTASLINSIAQLGDVHRPLITQIVERTGGNPFFVEEVMRSFVDERALVMQNGAFQATEKVHSLPIPSTIRDVLTARMDRLDEQSRDLLKVASVIGRTFLRRILLEVAPSVEGIDAKLAYFQEIQFIQQRSHWGETEYLFNHALVQEATYESILPSKRKELHLKVAQAIETLFAGRIHEFYGMLAYHYSMAESPEKTEEYLIKAGEEALRTAASDEALHYYKEAQVLYLKKSGTNADPEKVAMLEKNIALALYNRGRHEEALGHFDRALEHYWGKLPKNVLSRLSEFLSSFGHFATALFIPSLKFKGAPTQRDLQVFDLFYKKCKSLAITNPKRFFVELLSLHKRITGFDLQKLENGIGIFVSASPLFSFSGLSFGLSRKTLDSVRHRIPRDDLRSYTIFDICETMHHFLYGTWKEIGGYDGELIKRNCDMGEIWEATHLLYWHALPCIYQGDHETVESILERLNEIFQVYQYDLAKTYEHELRSSLLTECRRFGDALIESRRGIDFEEKAGPGFWDLHVCEARIYTSMEEMERAEKCFDQAKKICRRIEPVPFQMTGLYRAELEYNLYRLKSAMKSGDKRGSSEYRKKAARSAKLLLRNAQKVARYRTEAYRLKGEFYWLLDRQRKALAWWQKAIEEGERLGARLQLAVLFYELGKRLLGPESKHRVLNGIGADGFLSRARSMFEEMRLQSYLDELSHFNSSRV